MKGIMTIGLTLLASVSWGAASYTESFNTTGVATGRLSLGVGSWSYTGGVAKVRFNALNPPIAIPNTATLYPVSGSFKGDYVAAGIEVLGLKFRSETGLPSLVWVELTAGTSVYQKILPVSQVGVWETFMVPLTSAEAGGWMAQDGGVANFRESLRDVKSVAVKVRRSGVTAMEYLVDDLFADQLPQAAGGRSSGGQMTLAWDALQVGAPYRMERCSTLGGPWQDAGAVTPTSRLHHVQIPADPDEPQLFFRLRGP